MFRRVRTSAPSEQSLILPLDFAQLLNESGDIVVLEKCPEVTVVDMDNTRVHGEYLVEISRNFLVRFLALFFCVPVRTLSEHSLILPLPL